MKRVLSLSLAFVMLCCALLVLAGCGDDDHTCEVPDLAVGENGNWWLGDSDTGVSATVSVDDYETEFASSAGVDYCIMTLNFSNGTKKTLMLEIPKSDDGFVSVATITNGYGGANGIVCLMTDNDSGKFETLALLDELYVEYGLVGGLGTVVKNLYTDKTYTVKKTAEIAKWQEFLDTGRWKIINHSMTHTTYCDFIDGERVVNEDRLYEELITSAELLREIFPDQRVLTYAMTGTQSALGNNASSDPTNIRQCERDLIAEYYIGGRFKSAGATDYNELQWNNLPYALLSRSNLSTILSNVDKAAEEGKFYMVYNHYVIEDELFDTVNESSWTNKSTAEALCERVAQYVNDGSVWNAHYEDAVMYMRERETASVLASYDKGKINVLLTDKMDDAIYNHKLTVRITVPEDWAAVKITQGSEICYARVSTEGVEHFALANILPDGGIATIEKVAEADIPEERPSEIKPTPDIASPSTPATPPTSEIPDVYTFDTLDGYLGNAITFANEGIETTKLTVALDGEEKVLKLEKPEGSTNPTVTFKAKDLSGAASITVETRLKLERTSSAGEVYINLAGPNSAYAYRAYIQVNSDGTLKLIDYRSGDSSKASSISFDKNGEWIDLKLVYTVSEGTATVTVYSADTKLLTSNNHYVATSDPISAEDIVALRISASQKYLGNVYLDNLSITATK